MDPNQDRTPRGNGNLGTLTVIAEWENAEDLADQTALANILNLAERIVEVRDIVAGKPGFVMVSDPLVSNAAAFGKVLSELCKQYGEKLAITSLDCPGGEYTDQKIAGVAATDSDIIAFADSDCRYHRDWLRTLLAPLANPDIDYAHGRNIMMVDSIWGQAAAVYWFYPLAQEVPDGPTFVYFSNLAFRRSAYLRYPFPGNPGNRVACAMWTRGLEASGLRGCKTMATADHPPAYGLGNVVRNAIDYSKIDDGRYAARNFGRGARVGRATLRLLREVLHSAKRCVYVGVVLRLNPLRVLQTLGIGLVYSLVTGIVQIGVAMFHTPQIPSVAAPARKV